MSKDKAKVVVQGSNGNAVYGLGLIGAAVYYIGQASGFGEVLVALLKSLVWPAYLVYELLQSVVA